MGSPIRNPRLPSSNMNELWFHWGRVPKCGLVATLPVQICSTRGQWSDISGSAMTSKLCTAPLRFMNM